ncbi:hypothetical protein, partial [Acinetobacter seifertii]|uniref:hypothetical protein n=1 Tax=Acinetobacter seifertii TaxID=1530123 RepID=UPI003AF45137
MHSSLALLLLGTNSLAVTWEKVRENNASAYYFDSDGEFKHEVRQFEKSYDNQQAEQISLMVGEFKHE